MSNLCFNNVEISASTDDQKTLLHKIYTSNPTDGFFEQLRPIGKWTRELAGSNWGTKWDVEPFDVEFDGTTLTAHYDSAWVPPINLYEYLFNQGFEITASYYESGIGFAGEWINGEDFYLDNVEDLAREDPDTLSSREYNIMDMFGIWDDFSDEESDDPDDSDD